MKSSSRLVVALLIWIALLGPVEAQVVDPAAALDSMGSWMQRYQVPGVIAVFVDRSGEQWIRTFGYADYSRRDFANDQTLMPLGPASEWFSSAVLQKVWQEEGIAVAEPLDPWLDRSFWHARAGAPSLEQLLQHRSGFDSVSFLLSVEQDGAEAIVAHWNGYVDVPGDRVHTSRLNYAVAAFAAETATGKNWQELVEESGLPQQTLRYAGQMPEADSRWIPHRHRDLGYAPENPWPTALIPALGAYATADQLLALLHYAVNDAEMQTLRSQPTLGGLFPLQHPSLEAFGRVEQLPGTAIGFWYIADSDGFLFATANSDQGELLLRDFFGSVVSPPSVREELPSESLVKGVPGSYMVASVPQNGIEKIGPLLGSKKSLVFEAGAEHPLRLHWENYSEELAWFGGNTFVGVDSGSVLTFLGDERGNTVGFVSDSAPQETFMRLRWHEGIGLRRTIWSLLLIVLALEVFSPWLFPARRRRRPDPVSYIWSRRIAAWLFGAAFLLAAAALLNTEVSQLIYGLSAGLSWARWLLWPALVSVLALLAVILYIWIKVSLPLGRKLGYTLVWLFYAVLAGFSLLYHLLPM